MIRFNEYQAGGLSFILVDGRVLDVTRFRRRDVVHAVCLANGADGLALVENSSLADFGVSAFGADGTSMEAAPALLASAVAFADVLGVKAFHSQDYSVEDLHTAGTGAVHAAFISSHLGETKMVSIDGAAPVEALNLGDLVE